jgi:DNA-binding transcriptional regulator PaaX
MGKVEEKSRRKAKKGEVQKIILESIKVAGLLSVGLVAPNVIMAMKKVGLITNKRQGEIVNSLASRLAKRGLLEFNGKYYELTEEGERRLRFFELSGLELSKQKKWDKKWRVIIFDIPEKKKRARDQVRRFLSSAGLVRLQDSVWVYPYDCEEVIGLMKTDFGVGKNLLYMIVDEIENDKYLRRNFKLN